jgi:hypothetical protein
MNNRLIKSITGTVLCGSLLLLTANCTDKFEEFNTDPQSPTTDQMQGDNAATASLISAMIPVMVQGQENNSQMLDMMIGNEYGGMISNKNSWGTDRYYATYNPPVTWSGNMFDTSFPQIYTSYFQIKRITEGKGVIMHWANLLRVVGSIRISDCYGPIPYSQITGSEYAVAYDDMPDLYNQMFIDLDESIAGLKEAAASGTSSLYANADYIYQGNFTKWVKFANTIKLRMALRLVNVNPTLAQQKAEEAVNDSYGVITDPSDAAWSTFITQRNPFNLIGESWGEIRVNANITSYMNGYKDPRLSIYAKEAATTDSNGNAYVGARSGVYHYDYYGDSAYASTSKLNIGEQDKLLALSASESWFMRAEGALRGWNMGGSAKELYEKGVEVSMQERGASIGNYLSSKNTPARHYDIVQSGFSIDAVSTVTPAWDNYADFETNLERIMVQKWLGNFPNGWETWADFRRTGYPKFFPVVDNKSTDGVSSSRGMRRLPYPQSEFNTNEANVKAAQQMLGGADTGATDLWWAKKD